MQLERLQDLALRVSGERDVDAVLRQIVGGLSDMPDVALARIWVKAPGDLCESCHLSSSCENRKECLHLAASQGTGRRGEPWSGVDGYFRRIPLGHRKVGTIAARRQGALISDPLAEQWTRPEWVRDEGIEAFAGQPLVFDGETQGVLAVFCRQPVSDREFGWLRMFADQAASAIANARAFSELEKLRQHLELLDSLLGALADTLDVAKVFEQLSAIARRVIPLEMLALVLLSDDQQELIVHAVSGNDEAFPERIPFPAHLRPLLTEPWEHRLIDDIASDPVERALFPAQKGYRAQLVLPIRLRGRFVAALGFYSRTPGRFSKADLVIGRRIADQVTLSLSHMRLVEEARHAAEAGERAAALERRVTVLTAEVDALGGHRRVVGESPAWKRVLKQATQVAATDTTVLLLGESGTGKEVVSRFIHRASSRSSGPFVAINCAALPEQLLESELFGHERGAFTGAISPKPGQLELASGGVLFLDEVSEMSVSAQAKFLRVLQEREFQRLGGTRVLRSSARVIAATNRDLMAAVSRGGFREDLYYRLNVFEIRLPALRERADDILPLSQAFLEQIGRTFGRPPAGISREARRLLLEYSWPGNVRQLHNALERAAILCEGGLITPEHLSLPERTPADSTPSPAAPAPVAPKGAQEDGHPAAQTDLRTMERAAIERALQEARFNKSKAARLLGLTRTQMYQRLRKYGLDS